MTTAAARHPVADPHGGEGVTPREVVWTRNKTVLYRYRSPAPVRHRRPVLLVYALINRPYVLDLRPGASFVGHLGVHGHDVFLLDWGRFGREDRETTLDELVGDHLPRAVERTLRAAGADDCTLMGYCMGGTMAAAHAAMRPDGVANLVALTTPIDFAHAGDAHRAWTDSRHLDARELARGFGNIPGSLVGMAAKMMRPGPNYVGVYDTLARRAAAGGDLASWHAMSRWVNDNVPFPGAAFAQWVGDLYQGNLLVQGRLRLAGRRVDLSDIRAALLTVAATADHIVPPAMARPLHHLTSSADREYLELPGGHVSLLTGSGARERLWPAVTTWLEQRSDPLTPDDTRGER